MSHDKLNGFNQGKFHTYAYRLDQLNDLLKRFRKTPQTNMALEPSMSHAVVRAYLEVTAGWIYFNLINACKHRIGVTTVRKHCIFQTFSVRSRRNPINDYS